MIISKDFGAILTKDEVLQLKDFIAETCDISHPITDSKIREVMAIDMWTIYDQLKMALEDL